MSPSRISKRIRGRPLWPRVERRARFRHGAVRECRARAVCTSVPMVAAERAVGYGRSARGAGIRREPGAVAEPMTDSVEKLARLALVARALTSACDAAEIIDIVVRQGMAGLGAEGGVLALVDAYEAVIPTVVVGYSPE